MKVYLTGIDAIKASRRNYNQKEVKKPKKKSNNYEEENDGIKEESVNEEERPTKRSKKSKRNNKINTIEIKKTNNFISFDDMNNNRRKKTKFFTQKDFDKHRKIIFENQKNKDIIAEELKEDFLDFLMLKEPKYADFDKISEDLQKQIYENYQTYNKNLLEIESRKKILKDLLWELEKSLLSNYYVLDNSLLPQKEELIEKTKLDILTKQQEYEGYKKIYDDLYNQNYLIKRQVLDEIDIDRANEDFHDQYKLLEIHAIVQVSKKQDSLNQIEEYYKKLLEDHEKEYKNKNKVLKDLRLEIEVFKEDEKDLIHKLRKLKAKRNEIKKQNKERQRKNYAYHENLIKNVKRFQKSFISMNKIFRSVNANNLDDVLLDVNSINGRFNNLKNMIVKKNQEISNLNAKYSRLNKEIENIKKEIKLNKHKKVEAFTQKEQDKIFKIKTMFKSEKDEQNEIREEIQKQIGVFQNGIIFLFHKIKALVLNIKLLKNVVPPKLFQLVQKYKNSNYRLNYDNINKKFFKQFSFLFFQYCNIVFYLTLRMMNSGINVEEKKNKNEILMVQVDKKQYLNLYEDKIKKTLKEYKHRSELKVIKQKELNEKAKQRELQEKIDNQLMEENKSLNKKQMYKKFIEYLRAKEEKKNTSKNKASNNMTKRNNSKKNSFFFTGIDSVKISRSNILESSSSSSSSSSYKEGETSSQIGFKKKKEKNIIIPFKQKEEFLEVNKNKLINMFSKYQNNLVKDGMPNIYVKKKVTNNGLKKSKSILTPKLVNNNFESQQFNPYFSFQKKNKTKKDEDINSKNNKVHSLFDENYVYDEEEGDSEKERDEKQRKKKEIKNYFNAFLKINKDKANMYKKKNDLQKLQMAYFGGRFLNTKINPDLSSGASNLEDMVDHYVRKQEHDQYYNNKKMRLKNYKRKSVYLISANKSIKDKVSFPWKREREKKCYSSNDRNVKNPNYTYVKSKYLDYKKNRLVKAKTQRFNKISLPPFSNTYNRFTLCSPNNLYRSGIE